MRYDDEHLDLMIAKLEQSVHRQGWDKPAHLAIVQERRANVLVMEPLPFYLESPPGAFVEFMGSRFASGDDWSQQITMAMMHQYPGFYGLAFICEVWANEVLSPEEQNAMAHRGESLADVPGSYEARQLLMADVYGQSRVVFRKRGQKPFVGRIDHTGGRATHGLYQMVHRLAAELPDDRCDREALAKMAVISPEAAQERWKEMQKP